MNRKNSPSDISREQFAPLIPLLENARKRTTPRKVETCTMSFVPSFICSAPAMPGVPCRAIPTGHSYFQRWSEPSESGISNLEETLKNQVAAARRKRGRNENMLL